MIDESGTEYAIRIQRVRCNHCKKKRTHSLLYDFLVPYCKYSVKALERPVAEYVLEPDTTYLGALNDAVSEAATLFRVVRAMLDHLPQVWMHMMQMLIAAGYSPDEILAEDLSPNSSKCKGEEKKKRLDWAAQLLKLIPDAFEVAALEGYPIFASGRGCRLLRAHSAECMLF